MTCTDEQPVLPSQNLDMHVANFVDLANGNSEDMRETGTYTFIPPILNTQVALVNLIKISGVSGNISDMLGFFSRSALPNGVVLSVTRYGQAPYEFANFKTNFDLLFYSNEGATGFLSGPGNSGQTAIGAHIHYDPLHNRMTKNDRMEILIQDDLSILNTFEACVFYKVVGL